MAGVFNGPDIKKLVKNEVFLNHLSTVERRAFTAATAVIENFLGKNKSPNYREIVREMIVSFGIMGVNMSLKIHFLHNHLDFFPPNLGDFSDEHGERFHKDIARIERDYKGKNHRNMLGQYCWSICRNESTEAFKRKIKQSRFLTK